MDEIRPEIWRSACNHVDKHIEKCRANDNYIDKHIDSFLINLKDDSQSDDDSA